MPSAAVALARSIFRKGADFTAAMAFELASTNLVAELAIIMIVLLGWQFMAAEFVGAPLMIVIMALLFRAFLTPQLRTNVRSSSQGDRAFGSPQEGMHITASKPGPRS